MRLCEITGPRSVLPALLWIGLSFAVIAAARADEQPSSEVSYYRDIRPIFQAHCQGCHQPAKRGGGYVMTDFDALIKGGESETAAVVARDVSASYLVEQITPVDGAAEMPKNQPPLSADQRKTIEKWIAQGAEDDTPAGAKVRYTREQPPVYASPPIITAISYSPDGKWLAISGYHEVLVFRADGSERVARLVGLSERIEAIAFSPDGELLAVTGGKPARMGEVQVWRVDGWSLQLSVPVTYDTVYGASWSPDGTTIAFGCADNTVRAINAEDGEQVLYQAAHNDWALDTTFSVDGKHLISVGRDRTAKLIEFESERFIDNITSITPKALKGGILSVYRHPEKNLLLVGGADGTPKIYRTFRQSTRVIGDDANLVRRFPSRPGRVFEAAFGPTGKRIASASSFDGTGEIRVYNTSDDDSLTDEMKTLLGKGTHEWSADERKKVAAYHTMGVELVWEKQYTGGGLYAIAFSTDGKYVACGGFDGQLRILSSESGELVREFSPAPAASGDEAELAETGVEADLAKRDFVN